MAVIGVPDSKFGEIVVAYVTVHPNRQASSGDLEKQFVLDSS